MIKISCRSRYPLLLALILALPVSAFAQLVIGQYEDEAPLRTWNSFGLATAASIGRGETVLAQTDDCSSALSNPALLAGLPKFTLCLNGSYSRSSLFRYSIVNTGVLVSEKNLGIGLFALDFGGLSFRISGWTFALTAALSEVYDRPGVHVESVYQGVRYSAILFDQSGFLRTVNAAVARSIGSRFQVGVGLNFVRGELQRKVEDENFQDEITISHRISQTFSGFYINVGVLARVTDRLDLAAAFKSPYGKKSRSRSELRYQAPLGGTDILIAAASEDLYHQPWAAGVGIRYGLSPRFRVFGDLMVFHWSEYRIEYFGEKEKRDFDPAFRAAVGGEYSIPVRLLRRGASIPLRFGIGYDRQPMKSPGSAYAILSAGTGIHWRMFGFDIGGQVGRESGSGSRLEVARVCLSICAAL